MSYVLENEKESERLEKQAQMTNYSLDQELHLLDIPESSLVFDAGCGSGVVSRYMAKNFKNITIHAHDFSEVRLEQAAQLARSQKYENIHFYQCDLQHIERATDNSYDFLINRFVLEHLENPQAAVNEFYRVLKPNGRTCLIDLDGIFLNVYTSNEKFNELHNRVIAGWPTDLFMGRKIPAMMEKAGFKEIQFENQTMNFKGDDLKDEYQLTIERLEYVAPTLEKILTDKSDFDYYVKAYKEEFFNPSTVVFYNKFIVYGQK